MQLLTIWQYGSSNPDNANNLQLIGEWWKNLNGKEITWVQRLVPEIGGLSEVHWQRQRFDEEFIIVNPQMRGLTLYWYKPDSQMERGTTVQKLELDNLKQQLYIYPQSQSNLVIRVGIHETVYQTIELNNVDLHIDENGVIFLREPQQKIEVKLTLSPLQIKELKEWLP